MVRVVAVLLGLTLLLSTREARACSCAEWPLEVSFAHASFVAEVEILDVIPAIDSDHLGQPIRARIVRVFKGPPSVADGDELTFLHHTCTSEPYGREQVGDRFIGFFPVRAGRISLDFCDATASARGPLPAVLRQARAAWLESRR